MNTTQLANLVVGLCVGLIVGLCSALALFERLRDERDEARLLNRDLTAKVAVLMGQVRELKGG